MKNYNINDEELYKKLFDVKFDVERALELGAYNLMRRDYKTYDLFKGNLGVGAVTVLLNDMFMKYLDTGFFEGCEKMCEANNLGIFIVQCTASEDGKLARELLIYSPKERRSDLADYYCDIISTLKQQQSFTMSGFIDSQIYKGDFEGVKYCRATIESSTYSRKILEKVLKEQFKDEL